MGVRVIPPVVDGYVLDVNGDGPIPVERMVWAAPEPCEAECELCGAKMGDPCAAVTGYREDRAAREFLICLSHVPDLPATVTTLTPKDLP